jgi:hypothetical protein
MTSTLWQTLLHLPPETRIKPVWISLLSLISAVFVFNYVSRMKPATGAAMSTDPNQHPRRLHDAEHV